jgi:hypothetical protein
MNNFVKNALLTVRPILWMGGVSVCLSATDAQNIAVVRSRDMPAFDLLMESFTKACPAETASFNLSGKKVAEAIRQSGAKLTLVIGLLAANGIRERLTEMPLVYCMVSNPHRYG